MKHNRLVSLDHSKKTTKRYRLIVNAKKRNIIDSFADLIRYPDKRISAIVDVTKTISLSSVNSSSLHLDWQNVFTMIRLSHQTRSKSSRKHHIKIFEQWSNQKFSHQIRSLITNISNHLFSSRIFRNSIIFLSKSIVLFYQLDSFSIESKNESILR